MFLLKPRFMIPFALLVAVLVTYSAHNYLKKQKESLKDPQKELQSVVVVTTNLLKGTTLNENNLKITEWPKYIAPKKSFSEIEVVVNRILKEDIYADEPIIEPKLAPKGSMGGFSSLIPKGMRAITVSVDIVSGVSGFILPKTRVDVVVISNLSNEKKNAEAKIILENVEVLAVDQNFKKNDSESIQGQSVTLLVTPAEAAKLAVASKEGKLLLTLRNATDDAIVTSSGVKLRELFAKRYTRPRRSTRTRSTPKPKIAPATPQKKVVEVIRSGERSEVSFDEKKKDEKNEKK